MRLIYLIGFLVSIFLAIHIFKEARYNMVAKESNYQVNGRVTKIPTFVSNKKYIEVALLNKTYSIRVSANEFISNKYKVGDEVLLYYSKDIDHAILINSKPEPAYYFSILFFIIPVYSLFKILQPIKVK